MIGGVKTEIMHLNKIVENFLAYARPTRKTGETVDLVRAVHEAVASVGPEMESRGVTCQVEPVDQEVLVNADPTGLHQSLGNILLNAAQAMDKPEKRITVTTQVDGQRVDLTIGDTGRGIPPDELQRIFEVFYSSRSGGSGLGLPTARRVIEDVGGSMTVDSLAGHGTQVTITLPLAKKRRLFG
jgi:signal transduction histidine kinase